LKALAGALSVEWADKGVRVAALNATDPDLTAQHLLDLCTRQGDP
jgi:hypothetical protein